MSATYAMHNAPRSTRPSIANLTNAFSTWTLGVPYPLLFAAGAALGILFASLIVLCSSSRGASASAASQLTAPIVAPVTAVSEPKWQPNVIVIRPAAPDPMFDGPMVIDPPSMPAPAAQARPAAPAKRYGAPRRGASHRI